MPIHELTLFRAPFATPRIYRAPFRTAPAWAQLHRHWLWSPLGQRYFVDLVRRRLPSALWPRPVIDAVIDAVADVLVAEFRARRRKGGRS